MTWMAVDSTSMGVAPNGSGAPRTCGRRVSVPPARIWRQGHALTAALVRRSFRGTQMQSHAYVAIVTLLALLTYFWMGLQVGRARDKCGISAPAMTGDPVLERTIRAHHNTLEWLPLFLVPMWLFALYWNDLVAAGVGLVWIAGRIVYQLGYVADPAQRG